MLLLVLFFLAAAWEELVTETREFKGKVKKFESSHEKIDMPEQPLVWIKLKIELQDGNTNYEEYSQPKPYMYISRNANPEYIWDYEIEIINLMGKIEIDRIPYCRFLIIRIDGGLNNEFSITPSYGLGSFSYTLTVTYMYCLSNSHTSFDMIMCDVLLVNENTQAEFFGSMIDLPYFVSSVTFLGKNMTISDKNFNFASKTLDSLTVYDPSPGKWFITGNGFYNYTYKSCDWITAYIAKCNNLTYEFLTSIPLLQTSGSIVKKITTNFLVFEVQDQDIKYWYEAETKPSSNISVRYQVMDIPVKFPYLRAGYNYLSFSSSNISISLYKAESTSEYCNGHSYKMSNELVYICDCDEQYTGRHCEKEGLGNSTYILGLLMLSGSNLAMIPAIILGTYQGYYGEVVIFAANMIASGIYHICDYGYYCFSFKYSFLHDFDFILSYLSVMVTLIYLIRLKSKHLKLGLYAFLFVFLLFIGTSSGFKTFATEALVRYI